MRNEDGIHVSYSLDEKGEDCLDEIIANGCELVHLEQMDKMLIILGFIMKKKMKLCKYGLQYKKMEC